MQNENSSKGFLFLLKKVYWEWCSTNGRFAYLQYFFAEVPGYLGERLRAKVYGKYFQKFGSNARIFPGVRIRNPHQMSIGEDACLGLDNSFDAGGGLEIGARTLLGPGCKVWTVNHVFDDLDVPIADQGAEFKPVKIGSDVWLAANVFVMPGVDIPKGCIVTAGTVVGVKKYPEYSIISGNPGRVIGNRKKDSEAGGSATKPESKAEDV